MVESIIVKGIEQVPALVMLGLLVYYLSSAFLKAMAKRDDAFLGFQRVINEDLKDISLTIHSLCEEVRSSQAGSCNFHEKFSSQIERIEQQLIKSDK